MTRRVSLVLLAILSGCGGLPPEPADLIYPGTDHIRVTCAPKADFGAPDVRTIEVNATADVRRWRETLTAVPHQPQRGARHIKFVANAVEYRIEFVGRDGVTIARHRMKGSCLDVAAHQGWAFYSGEDRDFVALVNALFADE